MKDFFSKIEWSVRWKYTIHIISNQWFLLSCIIAVAAFLRFKGLTFQSLWFDELLSVTQSSPGQSFDGIISVLQSDPHPPFFYLGLHYWLSIFGYTETAARLFTALTGIASVAAMYWLGKSCLNRSAGYIASLFTAFNYFNLYYSQEVRPYIFLFLFTALSYNFFIRLLRTPRKKYIILYGLSTALMLYSHYYGMIHLLTQSICLLLLLAFEDIPSKLKRVRDFCYAFLITLITYSPWLPTTLKMMGKSDHWPKKPKPNFFADTFEKYFGSETMLVVIFASLLLVLFIYYLLITRKETGTRDENKRLTITLPVIFAWIFFSLIIPYWRSLAKVPMFDPKYAIGTLPAFIAAAAVCLALFKKRSARVLLVTAVIAVSITGIFYKSNYYGKPRKQDWRGVARMITEHRRESVPNTDVYFLSRYNKLYMFYLKPLNSPVKPLPPTIKHIEQLLDKKSGNTKGIWVLPTHTFKPPKQVMRLLKHRCRLVETKKVKMGTATFWVHKSPPKKAARTAEIIKGS